MEPITTARTYEHTEANMGKQNPLDKTHYRVSEVADISGISIDTLHYWIRAGHLETDGRFGITPLSPYRIHVNEIKRILDTMGAD